MKNFNWTCPYCGQPTTIVHSNYSESHSQIYTSESKYGDCAIVHKAIACPNPFCKNLTLEVSLRRYGFAKGMTSGKVGPREIHAAWKLLPRSRAKPWPDYIPVDVRNTYEEASLIVNDSPRAAAAMARRCLQGIVRDFWQLPTSKRGNLGAELNQIKDQIDSGTWGAIQAVRSIGDIGAHMEKDVI